MVGVLVLSFVLMLVVAQPAAAQPEWCEDDPVFVIDGHTYVVTAQFDNSFRTGSTVATYALSVSPDATVSWYHSGPTTIRSVVSITYTDKHRSDARDARLVVSVSGDQAFPIFVKVSSADNSYTKRGSSRSTRDVLSPAD